MTENDKLGFDHGAPRPPSVIYGWARAIVEALNARGVDGDALAERAGLSPELLAAGDARASIEATGRLWRLAVDASGEPALGLTVSRFLTFPTFQALGIAIAASASVRDACERLVRYSRLVSDAVEYRLERIDGAYRFTIEAAESLQPEAIDVALSLHVRTVRALHADRRVGPSAVMLARSAPSTTTAYERFFRAPISFAAGRNALEFNADIVDKPLPSGQAEIALHSDEVMARYLARVDEADVVARVRAVVAEQLAAGEPSQTSVARALAVGPRTLQRRLSDRGTSFAQLVAETRQALATAYLREGALSVTEVAFLLGFAEVSSFSRAFRRWTGVAPSEFVASRR